MPRSEEEFQWQPDRKNETRRPPDDVIGFTLAYFDHLLASRRPAAEAELRCMTRHGFGTESCCRSAPQLRTGTASMWKEVVGGIVAILSALNQHNLAITVALCSR